MSIHPRPVATPRLHAWNRWRFVHSNHIVNKMDSILVNETEWTGEVLDDVAGQLPLMLCGYIDSYDAGECQYAVHPADAFCPRHLRIPPTTPRIEVR